MYIGRQISNLSDRVKLDSITASATATYNLLLNTVAYVPSSAESLTVSLNGVIQAPQDSYTVSGSTITFASTLSAQDSIDFILAERSITLQTPSAGSVGTSQLAADAVNGDKIADDSISDEHLDITAITGQTEKTSLADADKFLISDSAASGALKYVQKSNLPSGGLTVVASSYSSTDTTGGVLSFPSFVSTDYDHYKVIGFCVPLTDNVDFWLRPHNASGHYSAANQFYYEYQARYRDSTGGGTYSNGAWQDNKWKIADNVNRDSNSNYVAFNIDLYEWGTPNTSRLAFGGTSFHHQHTFGMKTVNMGGSLHTNINATGLDFLFSAGQIDVHGITIYGVNKA